MDSLARLLAVAGKEAREILRDRITLGIAIALPIVMMVLFGYAITLDVRDIRLAVLDEDGSPESRELIAAFVASGHFRLHATVHDLGAVERLLDAGEARAALVVPGHFAHHLRRGLRVDVQILLDGSFANTAIVAANYADAIIDAATHHVQEAALAARGGRVVPAVRLDARVRYNPDLRGERFVVPGLFAVILMAFPPLLTALAVVRERERGSILQIAIAPLRAWEFLGGKLLPYAAIAFLEMLLLLALGRFWFGVDIAGSVPLLLGLAAVYVLCTVGIGLLVSTSTRSQVVAILLAIVLTLMPSFLFSGFLFPIETMPAIFQWYTHLFPARHFMEISRGISLKAAGLQQLWPSAGLLVLYAAVVLTLACLRYRRGLG